jgi:general stress protein YciG
MSGNGVCRNGFVIGNWREQHASIQRQHPIHEGRTMARREYDWEEDYDDRRRGGARPGFQERGGRGFAGMDPERHREISSMGGRASHGGRSRDYDEDDRWGDRSSSDRGSRYGDDDYERRGGRGFAGMDPERHREISSMGGRASHGGRGRDYDEDDRWSYRSSSGRSSRYANDDYERRGGRGFAGMDPERHREISSMGGRASHGNR